MGGMVHQDLQGWRVDLEPSFLKATNGPVKGVHGLMQGRDIERNLDLEPSQASQTDRIIAGSHRVNENIVVEDGHSASLQPRNEFQDSAELVRTDRSSWYRLGDGQWQGKRS